MCIYTRSTAHDRSTHWSSNMTSFHFKGLYDMTEAERKRYDVSFGKLCCRDGGSDDHGAEVIDASKAVSVMSKSGLPPDTLRKIWTLADADK